LKCRDVERWARDWHLDGGEGAAEFMEWARMVLAEAADRQLTHDAWLAAASVADAPGIDLPTLGTVSMPPELDESNLAWVKHVGLTNTSPGRKTAAMDRVIEAARTALTRLAASKTRTPKREAKIKAAEAALAKAEITARDAQSEPRFTARGLDGRPLVIEPWRPDIITRVQYLAEINSYLDAVERQARAAGMVPAIRITKPYFFDWLVRRQLQGQSVAQIAKEAPPDDAQRYRRPEADRHTIDEALKRVAKALGLKLRKASQT
jgi:hypothetical protein